MIAVMIGLCSLASVIQVKGPRREETGKRGMEAFLALSPLFCPELGVGFWRVSSWPWQGRPSIT